MLTILYLILYLILYFILFYNLYNCWRTTHSPWT